jgi:Tol biopolymer transport system component
MQWDTMPTRIDQRVLRLGDRPELLPLVGDSGSERDGRLSPDGRWLAFQSDEAAQGREGHITVRPFPDVHSRRWVISPGLGRQPVWSRDGRELFYRAEDGTVMSVPVRTTPSFQHGPPVPVVTPVDTLQDWAGGPSYDVSPDGRRFLFIKAPELDIRSLHVVLNWDVAVKAKIAGTN